ncbi:MAG: hypothetical protein JRJ42_04025 [Deltaproteobacteria bacterium]|nr:hypothetical protein [Deltaproteobacteria bacterium]MBW2018597.1 hypothetical protein [Deltaproteobacteria bacterium]MBW2073863.1 hypothetical protein [Deltaproteobacteria bacterium]
MQVLKTYESDFQLWGKRDYVHGSHMIYQLFDAVKAWGFKGIDRMTALFRSNLREQGTYLLFNGKSAKGGKEKFFATFKLNIGGVRYLVGIKGNGKAVTGTLPDDEEALIRCGTIQKEENTAAISDYPIDRFINVIIALNKKLNDEIIPSDGFGPWFMAQLDLHFSEVDLSRPGDILVRLVNSIGGKMTKSVIEINGKEAGEIYFNRRTLA